MLSGNRIVAFFDGWMAKRSEGTELVALVVANNESNVDASCGDITTVKAKPRIGFGPTFGELSCISGRLCSIKADSVDFLDWPPSMHVPAEQNLDSSRLQ